MSCYSMRQDVMGGRRSTVNRTAKALRQMGSTKMRMFTLKVRSIGASTGVVSVLSIVWKKEGFGGV